MSNSPRWLPPLHLCLRNASEWPLVSPIPQYLLVVASPIISLVDWRASLNCGIANFTSKAWVITWLGRSFQSGVSSLIALPMLIASTGFSDEVMRAAISGLPAKIAFSCWYTCSTDGHSFPLMTSLHGWRLLRRENRPENKVIPFFDSVQAIWASMGGKLFPRAFFHLFTPKTSEQFMGTLWP